MKHQVGLLYFLCRGAQPLSYFSRKTEEERQGGNTIIKLAFLRAEKKGGEREGEITPNRQGGKGKRGGVVAPERARKNINVFEFPGSALGAS